jgi:hypothetical protein
MGLKKEFNDALKALEQIDFLSRMRSVFPFLKLPFGI